VHASIQERRGRRALYYDLDLVLHWTGHCALGEQTLGEEAGHAPETTAHTIQGVIKGHQGSSRVIKTTAHTIQGEFRLYNVGQDTQFNLQPRPHASAHHGAVLPPLPQVGQDTQFNLGGDPHTSYLYSVGVPVQFHNDERCELWARHLKYEASELFELVSALVGQVVTDLVRKAERDC
jgi:hypothetical protein